MKKISTHFVRNVFVFAVVLGLGYAVYSVNSPSLIGTKAEAGTTDNISGWIWSNTPQSTSTPTTSTDQGIGWISLNSTTDGSTLSYGVKVGMDKRGVPGGINYFSGHAWGENIGWISFNSEDTVVACGTPAAQINWTTLKVSGWAKALNGTVGGWDGCISLSRTTAPVHGVTLGDGGKFSGYAWGSDALGWIDFGPKVNGDHVGGKIADQSCLKELVSADSWSQCVAPRACTAAENAAGETVTLTGGTRIGQCVAPNGTGQATDLDCSAVLVCSPTSATPTPGKRGFWQF